MYWSSVVAIPETTAWELPSAMGAKSVLQLEMMPKAPDKRAENNPWPEWPRICKTDYGQQEAIAIFGQDPRVYTRQPSKNLSKIRKEMSEQGSSGKTGRQERRKDRSDDPWCRDPRK